MGYSWVYLGDATLPSDDARARWLKDTTDPRPHAGVLNALDGFVIVEEEAAYDDLSVQETFDALTQCAAASRCTAGESVVVRVLADKSEDAWLTYRWNLAVAFVALAKHGGAGRLDVFGFEDGPTDGFRIEAANGVVKARLLAEDEVLAARETDAYRQLLELAEAAFSE